MWIGTYEDWTPAERREWDRDLEKMEAEREQRNAMNQENLHWWELALEEPLFQVSSTQVAGTSLYVFDITQKPPIKEGVRNWDFEIVYPIYHELNEIIERTKPAKATQITIKTSSREHWEVVYTCEFSVDLWSYNKVDEITERLADQLTMKQDLNDGLLIQVSFQE